MADIFAGAASRFGSSFSAEQATLGFSNGSLSAGALVQQAQFNYAQAVTRLYEVGAQVVYYVGGRTQGQMSMGRVVGPGTLLQQFYATYGDVCQAGANNVSLNLPNRCSNGSTPSYLCKYVVITNVGFGVSAADMVVNENSAAMFSGMGYSET